MIGYGIYYFEFVKPNQLQNQKESSARIMTFRPEDINFLQIQNKGVALTLQKNAHSWQIIEPIQDQADQAIVADLIKNLIEQKMQNIETAANAQPSEFGLDQPAVSYLWKNNSGQSEKIQISSQKNFEGQSFAKINDEQKIRIVDQVWLSKAEQNATYFREKRLYREDLSVLTKVKIKSLNDEFILQKVDQKWICPEQAGIDLDQNKVRKIIKDFAEATIQDYVFEGEASEKDLKIKGLMKPKSHIEFEGEKTAWSASLNLSDIDKTLYAMTSKPSFLVKLDISQWEKFANVTLDSLRDRKSLMTFPITDVQKFYAKNKNTNYEFINENQTWKLTSKLPENNEFLPIEAEKILSQIHNLEISEFVSPALAQQFEGSNMIILKTTGDQLVYQLNWGPDIKIKINGLDKEVYLARTQLSKNIFSIDKNKLDELNFNKVFKQKPEPVTTEPPND